MTSRLREIKDDEVECLRVWRNCPEVRKNMYTRHEIGAEEHSAWWQRIKNSKSDIYRIFELNNKAIGVVAFTQIDRVNKNAIWAFYLSSEIRGQTGEGVKMEFAAIDFAFQTLELHKLSCEVFAFNKSVISLHKKFGFSIEGIFRENHLYDGVFIDVVRMAIFSSQWHTKRDQMQTRLAKIDSRQERP
ncbi:MAG: UDP-4-amino-4,6-dideoxy-N-acetyl-beta-L-altrosamine N-acetyltransferase [Helicobacteraceae bacterium]|jgi:UDP-4-amino-4,6-dideoxy-N-acetyl-beta-L-altrosamine N-acetyltransferase|nr:UDP-4-amino-4,6-dideoxy-N-acetyl-beta-L-altrosamine N-acetyltransferase [Helicobacteraceae bacterium]